MINQKVREKSLLHSLEKILELTKDSQTIEAKQILDILFGKGYAALFIILSLPFCLPIQIPGFSTPFGILLALLGFRFALRKSFWLPKSVLDKHFSSQKVRKIIQKTLKTMQTLEKILHPRLLLLTKNGLICRLHGFIIGLLALLLTLPLPIPFSNMLTAMPILCIGLGLLENDGIAIIIGYLLAILCFSFFIGIILLGIAHVKA